MRSPLGRVTRFGHLVQVRPFRSRRGSLVALAQHGIYCLCQKKQKISFDMGGASQGSNQLGFAASNGSGSGPREGLLPELLKYGQKGAIRVTLSTRPDLRLVELRLDISLGPRSIAADPFVMRACTSRDAPPSFFGGLGSRGGGCCFCLCSLDTGTRDWICYYGGRIKPPGLVGAGIIRVPIHLELFLVRLEAGLVEFCQEYLGSLSRAKISAGSPKMLMSPC